MKFIRYVCRVCLPPHLGNELACRCTLPDDIDPPHGCLYPKEGYRIYPQPRWEELEEGAA